MKSHLISVMLQLKVTFMREKTKLLNYWFFVIILQTIAIYENNNNNKNYNEFQDEGIPQICHAFAYIFLCTDEEHF